MSRFSFRVPLRSVDTTAGVGERSEVLFGRLIRFRPTADSRPFGRLGSAAFGAMELVGTGDARLFALAEGDGSAIPLLQVDLSTGDTSVIADVSAVDGLSYFDLAFWMDQFYIFNAGFSQRDPTTSQVWRYDLNRRALNHLGELPFLVIGADAIPCQAI